MSQNLRHPTTEYVPLRRPKVKKDLRFLYASWRIVLNVLVLWPLGLLFLYPFKLGGFCISEGKANFIGLSGCNDVHPFIISHFRSLQKANWSKRIGDSIWFFAWYGPFAGFSYFKTLDENHHRRIQIGWRIIPHDRYEVPEDRAPVGFDFQFAFRHREE